MSWNPDTKVLRFTFTPDRRTGLTDVFIPKITYRGGYHGYRVKVRGGVVKRGLGRRHVLIDARRGRESVTVVVRPSHP